MVSSKLKYHNMLFCFATQPELNAALIIAASTFVLVQNCTVLVKPIISQYHIELRIQVENTNQLLKLQSCQFKEHCAKQTIHIAITVC